jgi:hypothetical protein
VYARIQNNPKVVLSHSKSSIMKEVLVFQDAGNIQ